jgi:class 3 adenylate cyclase/tetratricopeptide (TPR) repeat protein
LREERKRVSALFADIVGSTALAGSTDPEEVLEIIGGAIARMIGVIEQYGGTVKDVAGDGVLALFGAPQTHEDDPERAVRAGLDIVAGMGDYSREIDRRLEVRVGIDTGLVVLAAVGAGAKVEYGAVGDTVNTAARLQSAAGPSTVLVGESTFYSVADAAEGDRLELTVKGKPGPVIAYDIRALRPSRAGRRDVRLVNRSTELATLGTVAQALAGGRGGVLVITGAAGTGKTALKQRLHELVVTVGATWLGSHCPSFGSLEPYRVYKDILQAGPPTQNVSSVLERIEQPMGSPEEAQRRIAIEVGGWLASLTDESPLVVAIDDLQWCDPSSLELTQYLLRSFRHAPILFVLAWREDFPALDLNVDITGASNLTRLHLGPLTEDDARALLNDHLGPGVLPIWLQDKVIGAADGSPLFLREILRSLFASSALRAGEVGITFDPSTRVEIPEELEPLLLSRLDLLTDQQRTVLCAASVVGRSGEMPLIEKMCPGVPVKSVLASLEREGLLVLAEGAFRFAQGMVQETAYRAQLRKHRRKMHAAVATALLDRDVRLPTDPSLLAHHLQEGGMHEDAFDRRVQAAERACALHSLEEAAYQLDQAIELGMNLEVDPVTLVQLHLDRGLISYQRGDEARSRIDLLQVAEEALELGRNDLQMLALTELGFLDITRQPQLAEKRLSEAKRLAEESDDLDHQVRIASRMCLLHANSLRFTEALELGDRALALAAGEAERETVALDAVKQVAMQVGDLSRLEETLIKLAAIYRDRGDPWYEQFVHLESTFLHLGRGRWVEAYAAVSRALDLNRKLGDFGNEPLHLTAQSWCLRLRGRLSEAETSARRAFVLAGELDHPEWRSLSAATLGWLLHESDRSAEAVEVLREGVRVSDGCGAANHHLMCLSHLARALSLVGSSDSERVGQQAQTRLDRVSSSTGVWFFGGHCYLMLAEVAIDAGRFESAYDSLEPLRKAARRYGWPELSAWVDLLQGICARECGWDEADARLNAAQDAGELLGYPAIAAGRFRTSTL